MTEIEYYEKIVADTEKWLSDNKDNKSAVYFSHKGTLAQKEAAGDIKFFKNGIKNLKKARHSEEVGL